MNLFYGEPQDLTDVFPGPFTSDVSDMDNEPGGEKEEENNPSASRRIVVGVIPQEDSDVDRDVEPIEGEQPQGEQQGTSIEVLQWPRPNEEQNLRVYTRRRRHQAEQEQVQGEEASSLEKES